MITTKQSASDQALMSDLEPMVNSVVRQHFHNTGLPIEMTDVKQEILIELWTSRARVAHADDPSAYAAQIAHTVCRRLLKQCFAIPCTLPIPL